MAKFGSPLNGSLYITQTYHTNTTNTAIDISALAGKPVYAIASGKVPYRSANHGSYCIQNVENSDLKVYYVHTYKWVSANTYVKKGDIICYIAPASLNGGYPTHLHLGLQRGRYIMNYFDKSIVFKAGFKWGSIHNLNIRNAWFNGGSVLNLSLFKDLNYESNSMKIGDKVIFTGQMNIRSGAGTGFTDTGDILIGAVGTVHDGSRTSQNEQFGKGKNDSYTWWDIYFNKKSGWVADTGRMKVTTKKVTNINASPVVVAPPQPPVIPPEQLECQKKIEDLSKEIDVLKTNLGKQSEVLLDLKTENDELRNNLKTEMAGRKESDDEVIEYMRMNEDLAIENNKLDDDLGDLQFKFDKFKQEGQTNFIKKIKDWVSESVEKILSQILN